MLGPRRSCGSWTRLCGSLLPTESSHVVISLRQCHACDREVPLASPAEEHDGGQNAAQVDVEGKPWPLDAAGKPILKA